MKLTTVVNFINVLRMHFLYKILVPKITKICFGFETFWCQNTYKKCVRIRLIKLMAGSHFTNILRATFVPMLLSVKLTAGPHSTVYEHLMSSFFVQMCFAQLIYNYSLAL